MKCPMKKYKPGDMLLFKNIPCVDISLKDIRRTGTIQLQTCSDEALSVEVMSGSCDENLCAWWCEDARKCAILVLAETQRKAVKK